MLLEESVRLSTALEQLFSPHKLNVAALGNVVRQLHVHHIVRFQNDETFPKPVWGIGDAIPYDTDALRDTVNGLQISLDIL